MSWKKWSDNIMLKIGVLASGRGSNLQSIINNVNNDNLDIEIAAVISDNRDAQALVRARKYDIYTSFLSPGEYTDKKEYEQVLIEILEKKEVELIVLAGFMRILSPYFVNHYYQQIINIHPSLLPAFPGLDAQKQAFTYGVKVSGCTVHFVDQGMDTGPIILQKAVPVSVDDTLEDLKKRILKEEHKILPQAIKLYSKNKLTIQGNKVFVEDV